MILMQELERATEGARDLDLAIEIQVFGRSRNVMPLYYTTSLDAALTLVSEGWEWQLSFEDDKGICRMGDPLLLIEPEAATPALALCIAALKAIEHEKAKDSVTSS